MSTSAKAIAKGVWREELHQSWRWHLLLQLGLTTLLLWRLEPSPAPVPLSLSAAVVAAVSFSGAFVIGLLRGREDLYGTSALRTLHVSPISGVSILAGLVLGGLPARLLSSLLMAAVTGWHLPSGPFWWSIPMLWAIACLSSMAGYTRALVALVGWVRLIPRSLAILWGIAVVVGLNLVVLLIFLLTLGIPAVAIIPAVEPALPWLLGGICFVVGLPVVWISLRPGGAGEWYREAYLAMQELGDGRPRTRPSRWPRLLPGAAGALQARQWREIWLNWFTWVRFAVMLLPFGLLIWPSEGLVMMAARIPMLLVLGFGLLASLGAFGELPPTIGSSDGPNIGLSMVAGVRARIVVIAKWTAALPLAILSGLATWVSSVLLGVPDLGLALSAGCIALGFGAIALAGGLFDLDPHAEVVERDVPELLRAALEQVPRKMGGVLGYFGGLAFIGVAIWLCQRWPRSALMVALGCAMVAHLAMAAGYLRLKRLGM